LMGGKEAEGVFYVKYDKDKGQYKILPILVTVLIDQDHIQDFLVELENSPMSIQVMDIELNRPEARVTKPEKGEGGAGLLGMGMSGSMGQMMMRMRGGEAMGMGRGRMSGYGGMVGAMQGQMAAARMAGAMAGMGGMGTGSTPTRKGTDVRSEDRAKKRKEKDKAIEQVKGPSLFDPHFDIIQVTVYGQARFFNPPAVNEQAQTSLSDSGAAAGSATTAPPAGTATAPPASAATGSATTAPPAGTATAPPATAATGAASKAAPETGSALSKQQPTASPTPAGTPKSETAAPASGETPKPESSKPDSTKGDAKTAAPKS
jgi:hypothetical protein